MAYQCSSMPVNINQDPRMLVKILTRTVRTFAIITPDIYPKLFSDFTARPQYFESRNLVEIFNLVREAKVGSAQKMLAYQQISTQLCTESTEQELNVLANLHREMAFMYAQMDQLPQAVEEIETAISSIEAMDEPFSLEVAMLYESAASLYMQVKNFGKAQKQLQQVEHTLTLVNEEINELDVPEAAKIAQRRLINFMLAKTYSTFCSLKMQLREEAAAKEYLARSLEKWETIENKTGSAYLFTMKCKCLVLLTCRDEEGAIETAENYLTSIPESEQTAGHRLWFMKLLADKGKEQYRETLKKRVESLSKMMPEAQLVVLLKGLGLINKKQDDKQKKGSKQ